MGQPFIKFFSSDWRSDPALRMCSAASRGVWIDLISIMMEADPYGYLYINGKPATVAQIAALTCTPAGVIKKAMAELLENGVSSQDDNGAIYSRRLVRDREKQEQARLFGKGGGNPALMGKGITGGDKGGGITGGVKGAANPHGNTRSQKPDTRSQKPEAERDVVALLHAACGIAGMDQGKAVNSMGIGMDWLRTGLSDERILEVIRGIVDRPGYKPKGTLAYFTPMIAEAAAVQQPAPEPQLTPEQQQDFLNRYVKHFARDGQWRGWGPKPGEPGCLASPEVLRAHGYTA
jgi:hypothetical protein